MEVPEISDCLSVIDIVIIIFEKFNFSLIYC